MSSPSNVLKDHALARLASRYNVAQFVSFAPGNSLVQRHSCVSGHEIDHAFRDAESAVEALIAIRNSVNIRTFTPGRSKGNPFAYGVSSLHQALKILAEFASEGYTTIVNETIDVKDGGVSGVALGGVMEFAPGDTPRAVEKAGVIGLPQREAMMLLGDVYGPELDVDFPADVRVEFSIHPLRVGFRSQHQVVWEMENVENIRLPVPTLSWPNHFSRHIGDKAFGLLVADRVLGLPVPHCTVIGRRVAPFSFGEKTGTSETWLRTAPAEPRPGQFTTTRGWVDPFRLLASEDPGADELSSVLAQSGVNSTFSGGALAQSDGSVLVEGVRGFGDNFMLGEANTTPLPVEVVESVRELAQRASRRLGPVKLEWAYDGERAWLLQLNLVSPVSDVGTIFDGEASRWHRFDASDGLDALRSLIDALDPTLDGVVVVGAIGVTSHVGDLLRAARIPARIVASDGVRRSTD